MCATHRMYLNFYRISFIFIVCEHFTEEAGVSYRSPRNWWMTFCKRLISSWQLLRQLSDLAAGISAWSSAHFRHLGFFNSLSKFHLNIYRKIPNFSQKLSKLSLKLSKFSRKESLRIESKKFREVLRTTEQFYEHQASSTYFRKDL